MRSGDWEYAGRVLAAERHKRSWSRANLAREAHLDVGTVARMENGGGAYQAARTKASLAKVLGKPADWLDQAAAKGRPNGEANAHEQAVRAIEAALAHWDQCHEEVRSELGRSVNELKRLAST